ncbi:hypothetical protein YW5DRAFT_03995 [Streptomyces sp. Ncost-T6T-1]|uniref:Uncharacterized protein n=1 Tax=Streptomyces parvus TaxID=66428 RepID=A0A7K3RTZ6_9ACTN|nr:MULTISPECIES: DUF6479 family protein [Streptomyces]NEC18691.1 hypothetical protein [Streptomyces parvus]SBU92463.1 hypothetical protein YW5DRAFT_03995 [Streptomyces sp. Ncost-T6T-1]
MDVLKAVNVVDAPAEVPLADGTGALGIFLGVVALAVVALLIGGFLLSKRKHDAEPPPPQPHEQPPKPERRTHIEQNDPHSSDRFPEDGHALSPYELKDHGNGPLPPDEEQPRG